MSNGKYKIVNGRQVAVKDTKTGESFIPTQAAVEKAKQKGTISQRPFSGQIFDFSQTQRQPGYKKQDGTFIRANNPRELASLKREFDKDRKIYEADESRKVEAHNRKVGYKGATQTAPFKMMGFASKAMAKKYKK